MKKYLIYIGVGLVIYFFLIKYLKRRKLLKFFYDLGFGDMIMEKFSTQELFYMKNYLVNYSRKGISLTPSIDPELYAIMKKINDKFKQLSGVVLFTNIN